MSLEQLQTLMDRRSEDEHLEFKEARNQYDDDKLLKYCIALANEGGGVLILGVTNLRPRRVVGTAAFLNLEKVKHSLLLRLRLRVEVEELMHSDGRVVVFHIPPRPIGTPLNLEGAYWMRSGESLVPMTPDHLYRIFTEADVDFSANRCSGASLADLDPKALSAFQTRWGQKSGNLAIENLEPAQILADAGLLIDGEVTYAALVLLGSRKGLSRHLPQAEVIFEYRSSDSSVAFQQRKEYREGFLLFADDLWTTINLRNEVQHFQDGLFIWDISTFNELAIREALLNAVSHRDYRLPGSVFVRQYPHRIEIVSPGGFLPGITPENILWKQAPRNRLIADGLARCGLVERSGQGADRMFEESIKNGKREPDFARTDEHEVWLSLDGQVSDQRFLRYLERVSSETQATFRTDDLVALERVHRAEPLSEQLRDRIPALLKRGLVERAGRGKIILSQRLYGFLGEKGTYTRKRGLDRDTNKELLLKHIRDNSQLGTPLKDLLQVLPGQTREQVKGLMREIRDEGRAYPGGGKLRWVRWFPGPVPPKTQEP